MWNLKNATNGLIYKTEIGSQMEKTNLQLPKGVKVEGAYKLGGWDWHIHTNIYEIDD